MSLNAAPKYVQLAVDLIQLLEEHQIDNDTVLQALELVKRDYQRKREQEENKR